MEDTIILDNIRNLQVLCGRHDQNLKLIEKEMGIKISTTNSGLKVYGSKDKVKKAQELFDYLMGILDKDVQLKTRDINYAIKFIKKEDAASFKKLTKENIDIAAKGQMVTAKTKNQLAYIESIKENDIVFGVGPAGTGKTYIAMAMAVNALKKGIVKRIILTRPAIEAGEHLGFLPGDLAEKVSPYLRPLYDALYDMMDPAKVDALTEQGVIEIAPLAYMRGRTLNDAFIVLDEAQNSTPFQMKMFLTRLGFDSKVVVTGDKTQSDLPRGNSNGLAEAELILKNIKGVEFVYLTADDVVRHELVQQIIKAYDQHEQKNA